ncbi:hypothetical protein MXB_3904, partial [Myxobolus squamalis]
NNVHNSTHGLSHKHSIAKKYDRHSHKHKSRRSRQSSRESIKEIKNDEKGHLIFNPGDVINDRCKKNYSSHIRQNNITSWRGKRSEEIALKVIRNVEKYRFTVSTIISHLHLTKLNILVLHSLNLTHTDLKPENLLFVNSDYEVWDSPNSSVF